MFYDNHKTVLRLKTVNKERFLNTLTAPSSYKYYICNREAEDYLDRGGADGAVVHNVALHPDNLHRRDG